ncbi:MULTISPECIES: MFS transporter [Dyella]|uniref:MFS transporter n=2 Tax=Dyella TaxID=231454 RepID=A0A4R0YTX9_9GAMM|nr:MULTISPECIES: MFS transporter [Dyella]TBR40527.1 MFS transporter [Dyella terrae]TCI11891.1 MFS transporter [Dyella soli]
MRAPDSLPFSSVRRGMTLLFAAAAGLSVANVYYAQPLLDQLAADFAISRAAVGGVITATQLGCGLALVFVVPLGDIVQRRRLMTVQLGALVAALGLVAMAWSPIMLLAGMLAVGVLGTAMTQGLIAYAASASAPQERGRVVGATQSGVFLGLLLARVFAGGISDLVGWRGVYVASALLMLLLALPLRNGLPVVSMQRHRQGYLSLLASMFRLLREERVLRVRGLLALFMWAAFNIFWSALVLPLSAAPFHLSHTAIGAFGLVGAVGALAAAGAGRWADQGRAERSSLVALLLLWAAWWPLSLMTWSLWALVIGILLLDMGGQMLHVTNQSMILGARPDAHSRLIGLYMLFYAAGSGLGAIGTTAVYAFAGWRGVCLLGAGVSLLALVFWVATRGVKEDRSHLCKAAVSVGPCTSG